MQPPSLPGPANQKLNWDVFARIFGKLGQMPIFRDAGWNTPKSTLTGDTRDRCICHHSFVCLSYLSNYCGLSISNTAEP
jgi:hypothetical protein